MQTVSHGMLSQTVQARLEQFEAFLKQESHYFMGYPCSSLFDYSPLYPFLRYPVNNVGDPFLPSNYHLNTHEFECEVVQIFTKLTAAPPQAIWGYVTNGGTEGNMYGIFLARELFPEGIVYYSEDTHYSVDKILRCLHLRSIMIKSQPDGAIDLDDLRATLKIHRDIPPIIFANIGTTMKGAVDDIAGIQQIFADLALQRHYIHADAALSGMILPFLDQPPPWNFAAGVDSLSISGHKMIGSPIPCGVVLAQKADVDRIAQSVEYIGTLDTTLMGSRNGITPLFLWYAFQTVGLDGFRQQVRSCLEVADYAVQQLNQIGYHAWRHPYANTVVFDRPPLQVTQKWQLAPHHAITHLIAMPHITKTYIDRLAADIQLSVQTQRPVPPAQENLAVPQETSATPKDAHAPLILALPALEDALPDILRVIAMAGINVELCNVLAMDDAMIIRLTVSDPTEAQEILNRMHYSGRIYGQSASSGREATVSEWQHLHNLEFEPISSEAILVQIIDRPGALAALTRQLLDAKIHLRSVRIIQRTDGKGVVAIATDQPQETRNLLQDRVIN